MAKSNELGQISLTGIFAAVANEMMGAVVRGQMLHRTKNIRDSGAPFESAVREQLSALLPRAFSVHHGYLFDADGACTPQLDAFLCSTVRAQAIFAAPEGAVYTPFSDAWAIGEIKASSASMAGHLTQVSDRICAVKQMRRELQKVGASFPELTSFLIVGDCQTQSDKVIAEHWATRSHDFPDFIVLLGTGELILPPSSHAHLFEYDTNEISPIDLRGPTISVLSSGDDALDIRMGKVLSWFFFALLDRLRIAESHDLKIAWSAISSDDDTRDSTISDKVAGLLSKAADPFSLAVIRKMKLNCIRNL
jgi:hypothetical protein